MDASRRRLLVAPVLAIGLLVSGNIRPVAAAGCTLSAPATGRVGMELAINGSGFPASASIDIELTVEGGNPDAFAVTSDASGAFVVNLTPEPIDVGKTTVVATAGSICSAQVQFTVLGENEAAPTASPAASGAPAAPSGAPRTDTVSVASPDTVARPGSWLGGVILLTVGLIGLLSTRQPRLPTEPTSVSGK
jgi:hypothetical protein